MHKCGMQKPETDNQTLPQMKRQQKKYNIQSDIKTLLGRERGAQ